jgi:hypothetical protein
MHIGLQAPSHHQYSAQRESPRQSQLDLHAGRGPDPGLLETQKPHVSPHRLTFSLPPSPLTHSRNNDIVVVTSDLGHGFVSG